MFKRTKNCSSFCESNLETSAPLSQEIIPIESDWDLLLTKYPIKVAGTNVHFTPNPWKLTFNSLANQPTEIFSASSKPSIVSPGTPPQITFANNIYNITFNSSTNVTITF